MSEKAPTVLGDALRDLADVCDLNPDWSAIGCLISLEGLRLNFHTTHDATPIDVARALLSAALTDEGAASGDLDSVEAD
jgi:hypothetical protein